MQFFRRYVLSEGDIDPDRKEDEIQLPYPIAKIWGDLEPETDEWDCRLLFEVTGVRLDESNHEGDDTSDEEERKG